MNSRELGRTGIELATRIEDKSANHSEREGRLMMLTEVLVKAA
jgi:hypothetical protein